MKRPGYCCALAAAWLSQLLLCAVAQTSPTTQCCNSLIDAGLTVQWPNSTIYVDRTESYWSNSSQLHPFCIVQPSNAQEVAKTVTVLVDETTCNWAVRSGGHATWAGSNNIDYGVTIDLGNMNSTTYHPENSTATILAGSRWLQAYETLDALNVTVPGGRAGTVGVAGLINGGGNSFYASRKGMVCDNVLEFEIVLANGTIVYATNTTNSDLFKAQKGGGSNFGIVTSYNLDAFEAPVLWGGAVTYNGTKGDELVEAMVGFTDSVENNIYSSSIIFKTYQPSLKESVWIAAYENTEGEVAGPSFDEFLAIQPNISSTMRLTNISDLTFELEQPVDYRDIWFTLSFKNDICVLQKAVELHDQLVEEWLSITDTGDFITQCMFQPMPTVFAKYSLANGGNMLGLDREDENAILWLATLAVKGEEQERLGRIKMVEWVDAVNSYAASIGKANDWVYLNYADGTQKPLQSYGQGNLDYIWEVARKYDPTGIFQFRGNTGFKISSAIL